MKLKDIKHKMAICREEINKNQHTEYIEAYLADIVRSLTEGMENGTLKFKDRKDFTDEEWQELVNNAKKLKTENENLLRRKG